jgi:hypothetical protein
MADVDDLCDAMPTLSQSPASGSAITGTTIVTITATDATGNQAGCTFIVNVTNNEGDTTIVAATTCDPAQVGVSFNGFSNQFGCDSLVTTITTLLPSDTTNVAAATCDSAQVGVTVQVFTNQFGCDSTVITTTTFLPSDKTNVAATTCDPGQVGVTQQTLTNQFGCDSTVITATTLLPSDTTNVAAATCDPGQVGVTVQVFTNQFGCDSTVITTTTLLPSDTTNVAAQTCDPAQTGVTQQVFTNQFGCDSTVITTTTLLPSDTTNVAAQTCDPGQVGVTVQVFTNQFGCDSTVITTTTLLLQPTVEAGNCGVVYPAYPPQTCIDLTAVAGSGTAPYSYLWSPGGETTPTITVCPIENTTYVVEITDANGCTAEDKVEVQSIDISCKNNKVIICHKANNRSLCVNLDAVASHLGHGDSLGPCGTEPCAGNDRAANTDLFNPGIEKVALEEGELVLYPNPASSQVILQFGDLATDILDLSIYDINGKAIHSEQYNGVQGLNQLTIGVSQLPEGMYIIQMNSGDIRYQQKFIKSNK